MRDERGCENEQVSVLQLGTKFSAPKKDPTDFLMAKTLLTNLGFPVRHPPPPGSKKGFLATLLPKVLGALWSFKTALQYLSLHTFLIYCLGLLIPASMLSLPGCKLTNGWEGPAVFINRLQIYCHQAVACMIPLRVWAFKVQV